MTPKLPIPLYEISKLSKRFAMRSSLGSIAKNKVQAVDGVNLVINQGETLGLVGESGCGKTTLGRLLLRLLEPTTGSLVFRGQSLEGLSQRDLLPLRREMQIIFQDPYASLNPRLSVGEIIAEGLLNSGIRKRQERDQLVQEILQKVGLENSDVNCYPHEFSGGQRQRIGIARALVLGPKFIVADEPVSSLDVSIQAQILNLLQDLQAEFGLTYLLISHNLQAVQHMSDRVAVMYLGKIVELAPTKQLYEEPKHPYTKALLSAIPSIAKRQGQQRVALKGEVLSGSESATACKFYARCPIRQPICKTVEPPLKQTISSDVMHSAACHFADIQPKGILLKSVS